MSRRHETAPALPSPLRFFATLLAIFLAEAILMLLLPLFLPHAHGLMEALVDASFLAVLIALPLWWLLIRPLRSTALAEHLRAATVVANAMDGIITINEQGLVKSLNPAAARIFGYTAAELVGQPVTRLMPERYRDAHERGLERLRVDGDPQIIGKTVELHGLNKDGTEFPLEISLAKWETSRGVLFIGDIRDISERKRREEALRETSETLRAVIQASPLAITALDSEGRVNLWNPAARRIFGWSEQDILGCPLPIVPADKQEEFQALRQRVLEGEVFSGVEVWRQRRDGSAIDISISAAPLRNASGEIVGILGVLEDITERKRAEEARARLVAILETTTDFVATGDAEGHVFYYNRAARRMLGIGEEEDLAKIRIPDTHPAWANRIVLGEGIPTAIREGLWSGETALLRRDGREIPVSQVILAHKAPDGTVEYLSTIARDITERKCAEETRQALYRASLHIQEPLGLHDRLSRLLTTAREVLHLDRLNILLADREERWLQAVASTETEEPLQALRVPIGPEGGAIAQAYLTQQMIGWDRQGPVPESYRLKPPYDQIAAFRSQAFANVPLVAQGRAIGVLGADRKHSRQPLDAATLELLQLFAGQAAPAIEQARLYEAAQAEAKREAALRTVAEALTANLGSEAIFQVMVEKAVEVAHAEKGALFVFDPQEQELRTVAHAGLSPAIRCLCFKVGESVTGRAVLWGRPIAIPDVETDTEHGVRDDLARREGIRAILTMPLMSKEQVVGALSVYHTQPHAFTDDEITRLRLYGHQAAIAIENAQLYQASREHAARLETRVQERTRELEVANRGLEEASRHKSEFLANMSHEIRTPLNSIIGFAELVGEQRVGPLTEKQARYLGHIQNSGKHLLHLISDILDLSKVEAGKFALQPEPLPLAQTLEDILLIARGLANKKCQTLESQIEPDLPPLHADPVRFKQICFNLLSNAVKFTPDGGTIAVRARRVPGIAEHPQGTRLRNAELPATDTPPQSAIRNPQSEIGECLEIRVTDTGAGIRAEDLPTLFGEFVQLETTRDQHHDGSGLGLALTKKLVELHGGQIRAESDGVGRGSTFAVVLPFALRPE